MRVQLIKFLLGIVFVLFAHSLLFAQDPEMVRIEFLVEQLKLKPVPPRIIAAIPELYQPPRER